MLGIPHPRAPPGIFYSIAPYGPSALITPYNDLTCVFIFGLLHPHLSERLLERRLVLPPTPISRALIKGGHTADSITMEMNGTGGNTIQSLYQ